MRPWLLLRDNCNLLVSFVQCRGSWESRRATEVALPVFRRETVRFLRCPREVQTPSRPGTSHSHSVRTLSRWLREPSGCGTDSGIWTTSTAPPQCAACTWPRREQGRGGVSLGQARRGAQSHGGRWRSAAALRLQVARPWEVSASQSGSPLL